MFTRESRYAALPTATLTMPDGRVVVYVRRRFRPGAAEVVAYAEEAVAAGDRPDLVAARTLGDPEAAWRLADANDVMRPAELTAEPGRMLRIAAPGR